MAVDVGVFLPMLHADGEGEGQAPEFAAAARRAEELGFESVWASDHLTGHAPMLDATVTLATAAAVTTRIRLGHGVLTLPVHQVALLAKQLASLEFLSRRRLLVGVDAGGSAWAQWRGGVVDTPVWAATGVPYEERDERTDRALEQLRSLLLGYPTQIGDAELRLRPGVGWSPFLIGGESEADLRRAIRHGGWFPNLVSPAYLARMIPRLSALAAETYDTAPWVSVAVPATLDAPGTGERRGSTAGGVAHRYGIDAERAAAMLVEGTPQRAAEKLVEFARAGADRIVLSFPDTDWRTQYDLAARAMASARAVLPVRRTATVREQTSCGSGWARVTLDVERATGAYAFINPLGADALPADLAEALEEGVREGLAGQDRAVRVRRAWVQEVDAHPGVFREAGRKAVTEALAAERAESAERAEAAGR
ncbi:LLM class flavin-dependent oxidoreductase [Streptomyces sp. G5(2025)]|uniref:LLM class flavin-dependent oxidoreductase n=1 Tax=Streptomyces sp. G5(2025) TaxID=3406628 RepID=UPI003C147EA4